MGMVDKLCCDHRASERVATRPSTFPLGEVATMKATHSDSHSVFVLGPRRSSQLNHFSPTCSICSLTKNAKSAANREVNMEIITIRVSTNTKQLNRELNSDDRLVPLIRKESRREAESLRLHRSRCVLLRREHFRWSLN